jgi:hypothetical protein
LLLEANPDQTFVVRAAPGLDPEALLEPARQLLQQRVPTMAIQELTTMDRVLAQATGPARQIILLLGLLATLAVALGSRSRRRVAALSS